MELNDVLEQSMLDRAEFRGTRIAPATTLVIGTALLTQLMVLSSVAIIMGVAVVTMCALVFELLVLTIVATVLERGVVDLNDLGNLMEITATILVTVVTLVLAIIGGSQNAENVKTSILDGYPVAALKLS